MTSCTVHIEQRLAVTDGLGAAGFASLDVMEKVLYGGVAAGAKSWR